MDYTRLRYDDCFVPEKALLAIEKAEYHDALVLPEGTYLCRTVRGPAQLTPAAFEEMSAFMGSVPNVGVSTRFRRAGEARPRKTAIV